MPYSSFYQRRVYYKTGPAGPVRYGEHLNPFKEILTEDGGKSELQACALRVLAGIERPGGGLLAE